MELFHELRLPENRQVYIAGAAPAKFKSAISGASMNEVDPMRRHPLINKARLASLEGFAGKLRKVPHGTRFKAPPFSGHTDKVAHILFAAGYGSEVVAAGYLHDHIEDLPALWNKQRLAVEFTPRVADLVDWVTQQDKSLSWEERNRQYEENLRLAPADAVAISVADKISNMGDCLKFLRLGYPVSALLKRGWKQNSERYHRISEIANGQVPEKLLSRFNMVLAEFDRLGAPLELHDRAR